MPTLSIPVKIFFFTSANEYGCNDEAAELFLEIMLMLDLSFPYTWLQGLDLYTLSWFYIQCMNILCYVYVLYLRNENETT